MSGEDPVTEAITASMDDAGIRESSDAADVGTDVGAEAPVVAAGADPVAQDKAGEAPAVDDEAEIEAIAKDLREKNPKLRGRIGVDRHQAVLTRERNKHGAEVKELRERLSKLEDYEKPEWALKRDALALAEKRPDLYLDLLAEDARYKAEFEKRFPKTAPAVPVKEVEDLEPQPDRLFEDGTTGYSQAGAAAHAAWTTRQAEKKFEARLAPIEKAERERQERQRSEQMFQAERQKSAKTIAAAREKWDGYQEHEKEIQEYFLAHEDVTLHEAYIAVVPGKLRANRDTVRAEERAAIIKEMNDKAQPPSRPGPGQRTESATDPNAPRDTEDIIRAATRKLAAAERAAV